MDSTVILSVAITLISVALHEFAHGYAAYLQGDMTAKYAGRLTVNPLAHLDLVGSLIVPAFLIMTGSPAFGWAKPVPYNPYNLRNRRWGEVAVAAAGPITNVLLALIFAAAARLAGESSPFFEFAIWIVVINIAIALFNMIPVPPLDGSKILGGLLGRHGRWITAAPFSTTIVLALIAAFVIWPLFAPIVLDLTVLLTGARFG